MPDDPQLPDLVIIGDSHTAALQEAALAQGLTSRMLYVSGNFWHEGSFRYSAELGLAVGHRPVLQRRIRTLAGQLGGTVFPRGVPIIASFGYHLGRLVPVFARLGHTPDPTDFDAEPHKLFASSALVDAYLHHHRGSLWRVLRLAAQKADLVVVAPPIVQDDPVAMHIAGLITARLTALGLRVFDPRLEPDWAGRPLPAEWRTPDGVHGNALYGAEVLRRLEAKGLLARAA